MNTIRSFLRYTAPAALLAITFSLPMAFAAEPAIPTLSYFNQSPPDTTPAVFAPGIVSTDAHEFSCSLSPDGREFFFTRNQVVKYHTIMVSTLGPKGWSDPEPFAPLKEWDAFEPCVSADGRRIYFVSGFNNPGGARPTMDLWYIERSETGWSEPVHPGAPFNPEKAMFVSTTLDGTIYTTYAPEGPPKADIARSHFQDGKYLDYEVLGPEINSPEMDAYPYVAPDESYLIFSSSDPEAGRGLFISFRDSDGNWGKKKFIALGIENPGLPWVSPDGRYLFFTSNKDIYWVDSRIFMGLKK